MKAPRVLVTETSRSSALSFIRSLGSQGWHVVAADANRLSPGFYSRYAREHVVYPPPLRDPDGAARVLLDAAKRLRIDLVIPVTDELILALSRHEAQFSGVSTLAMPDADRQRAAADKLSTLELADRLSVPTPRTVVVSPADAGKTLPDLGWPVVLKPRFSRILGPAGSIHAFSVAYATNRAELERELARFGGETDVLLQEHHRGIGRGVELLMRNGQPIAAFQHQRIREVPPTGGVSSMRVGEALDPVLYQHATNLLSALDWTGLAMVEFKTGPHGPILMEINGRVWGSLALAVASGVDFPRLTADLYLDRPLPDGLPSYAPGVRASNLLLDFSWIASVLTQRGHTRNLGMPPRRAVFGAIRDLLSPGTRFDVFSAGDPRPAVAEILAIAGRIAARVRGRS